MYFINSAVKKSQDRHLSDQIKNYNLNKRIKINIDTISL